MRRLIRIAFATAVVGILPCAAGTHSHVRVRVPPFSSVWNLIPGSGARYEVVDRSGRKFTLELSIVGRESIAGKDTYWMEVSAQPEAPNIATVGKVRFYRDREDVVFTGGLIEQMSGYPARVRLPYYDIGAVDYLRLAVGYRADPDRYGPYWDFNPNTGRVHEIQPDLAPRHESIPGVDDLGRESVTTPAGTFSCEHFRYSHISGDVWIVAEAAPFGLVKAITKNHTTMILTGLLTGEKDQITGTPRPFNFTGKKGDQGTPSGIVGTYNWTFHALWYLVEEKH